MPLFPSQLARTVGDGRFVVDTTGKANRDAAATLLATGGPGPDAALVAKACALPCPGPESLWILRDASGAMGRLRFFGDRHQCSHVVGVWFDAVGTELFSTDDHSKSAEEIRAYDIAYEAMEDGYVEVGPFPCPPESDPP